MRININKKYALFFGISSISIILILVAVFSFVVVKKGGKFKQNLKNTEEGIYRENQGKTLFDLARYLGRHLFLPLYQSDISAVNRLINDMKLGLPFISFEVADANGIILTDGSRRNKTFGTRLGVGLARIRKQPIIVENTEQGERISFTIRSKEHVAGYGQILYSNEPLKIILAKSRAVFDSGWREFEGIFLRISVIGILAALAIAALMSFLFSGRISRPLVLLKEAASRVAQGDLDYRIKIDSNDEIGDFAAAFNQMVSDLKRSTEELQEANKKLKQLDQLKSDVISIVSHELRTPITSIKAFTELILMKPNMEPDRQKKLLTTINDESDRLARIINDVLDLAKIEEGRMSWHIDSVLAADILHRAIDCVQALADNKNIAITRSLEPALPPIKGDKDKLIQVATNILSNAVKFTPEGGTVRIHANLDSGNNRAIRVSIADSGKGIPPEQLQLIFEKFYRTDDTLTSDKNEGSGLGLTIARSIVEYHEGKIWAESIPGSGSTFTFILPLDGPASRSISA